MESQGFINPFFFFSAVVVAAVFERGEVLTLIFARTELLVVTLDALLGLGGAVAHIVSGRTRGLLIAGVGNLVGVEHFTISVFSFWCLYLDLHQGLSAL